MNSPKSNKNDVIIGQEIYYMYMFEIDYVDSGGFAPNGQPYVVSL